MSKIETRIKNKEHAISNTIEQVKTAEQQMIGLEEVRLLFSINKNDVLKNGCCNIKCDLDIYKKWKFWPRSIGGDNEKGFAWAAFFHEDCHFKDEKEMEVSLSKEKLFFSKSIINKCGKD